MLNSQIRLFHSMIHIRVINMSFFISWLSILSIYQNRKLKIFYSTLYSKISKLKKELMIKKGWNFMGSVWRRIWHCPVTKTFIDKHAIDICARKEVLVDQVVFISFLVL